MALYPEIIVGTYEEFLLGYQVHKSEDGELQLSMTVAVHAHQGSVRCVATHKHLLASSGADEYVNIFSLINKKEVAILTPHIGTVTCLAFVPDGSHFVSASQDGSIAIVRCTDWRMMKIWKDAHKRANGVVDISIHPTGKLLLSIGADNILRVWNLIKGRQAYAVNFSKKISPGNTLNIVKWSQDGSFYAVCIGQLVEIFATDSAAVTYSFKSTSRISSIDFSTELMALGRDDGVVEFHDVKGKKRVGEETCHSKRVKCAQFFCHNKKEYLVTADSQGSIKLWLWTVKGKQKMALKAEVNADCRILCLTLVNPNDFAKKEALSETVNLNDTREESQMVNEGPSLESTIETTLSEKNNLPSQKQKDGTRKSLNETPNSGRKKDKKKKAIQMPPSELNISGEKRLGSFNVSEVSAPKRSCKKRSSTSKWEIEETT